MAPLRIVFLFGSILLAAQVARGQTPQPYGLATFGEFRKMAMQRDYSAKAALATVLASGATDAVGAVTDARGEVTIVDGRPIVSYGEDRNRRPPTTETAMLLATATVRDWQEIPVGRDIKPAELESFLAEQGKSRGIDPEKSFPFRLRGTLMNYVMHVTKGPGSGHPPLSQETQKGDALAGLVVGLYVAPQFVGIATHPGERTHSHWINDERTATAHLDGWGVKSGAVLLLPRP
jgi:hypothetical protein